MSPLNFYPLSETLFLINYISRISTSENKVQSNWKIFCYIGNTAMQNTNHGQPVIYIKLSNTK